MCADWLEELAVFATPERFYDAETAHHLSRAVWHWYVVKLAIEPLGGVGVRRICHPANLGAL